ncbi:UDP-N-acetylmuramoyl-tripeptide--D-alanyl-D-alanine ligase [Bacteroidetes bacterium endosymbiont of Geopemphigus sp.]|uniref:UDP-N-acetylmuramoyl-tripeptide--D-alanyl-D- alanine ligase n=1 Tax=Bacteroidetes bacterium endosymbiont of Geopemphigus sp. TaxID=2047937 RepID=UPI000CD18C11|nr:UDP-N-acetylmuramoyl-tripeptide--D-alanyl-D-alanine ligase [Bacteroidetes bacterium endosymbiont of Geopemphigus sp.]
MYTDTEALYEVFLESTSVFTDSRCIVDKGLFFALRGDRFDGNHFTEEALAKGAHAVVTDDIHFVSHFPERVFYVKDTVCALQQLAAYHRSRLDLPVIAITGSNGKTTTKELIARVLSKKYKTLFTQGNLNNHIGLPLTLLKLCKAHKIAVIEMGANHLGEIAMLSHIARPDYGYITNFGSAHLEGFGGREGVIRAKSELYDYLRLHKKTAFVYADDPLQMQKSQGISRYFFSKNENMGICVKLLTDNSQGVYLSFKKTPIQSHLTGVYNFINLSAAIAIADRFKVSAQEIKMALESYYPDNNRSQYFKKGSLHVFLDAYNANPSSMEAAIAHFERLKGTKTAILGDMLELGVYSTQAHLQIVKRLQNTDISQFFLIGPNFSKVKIQEDRIRYFPHRQVLENFLKIHPIPTDHLLIKGSRKLALEKLVPLL